jgi:hypothetical protein
MGPLADALKILFFAISSWVFSLSNSIWHMIKHALELNSLRKNLKDSSIISFVPFVLANTLKATLRTFARNNQRKSTGSNSAIGRSVALRQCYAPV